VISLGLQNGYCKDYDLHKKSVVRNTPIHKGQTVTSIASKNHLLVSVGADGRTVVYDYAKQEVLREMEAGECGIGTVQDLVVMEDFNTLVLADSKGLHPLDIEQA